MSDRGIKTILKACHAAFDFDLRSRTLSLPGDNVCILAVEVLHAALQLLPGTISVLQAKQGSAWVAH